MKQTSVNAQGDWDSVVTELAKIEVEKDEDIVEPYDPAYITNTPYQIPDISASEKRWLHKVGIVENKLKREHIHFEWLADWECFRVQRFRPGADCPQVRYIRINMEENEYAFGDENYDLVYDSRISPVIAAVKEWVNRYNK